MLIKCSIILNTVTLLKLRTPVSYSERHQSQKSAPAANVYIASTWRQTLDIILVHSMNMFNDSTVGFRVHQSF